MAKYFVCNNLYKIQVFVLFCDHSLTLLDCEASCTMRLLVALLVWVESP